MTHELYGPEKYAAHARAKRTAKRIMSGKPLPMFAREGEGYSTLDARHIKIGNLLHLKDLSQEKLRDAAND